MVSYFFFDFNNIEKQSSRKAIRSLLFQFALQAVDVFQDLEQLYMKCSSRKQQPTDDTIYSMFKESMAHLGEKYIILDALDECTDREELLTFIRELIGSKPRDLRILATSRRERDIDDELSSIANHNIDIQSAVVDADIRVYIQDRMATDTKLGKWPDSVKDETTSTLMEKAGGMYGRTFRLLYMVR